MNLKVLNCEQSQLAGTSHGVLSVWQTQRVTYVCLFWCAELPDLSNLVNLKELHCQSNQLTGSYNQPACAAYMPTNSALCAACVFSSATYIYALYAGLPDLSKLEKLEKLVCAENLLIGNCLQANVCSQYGTHLGYCMQGCRVC